MAVVHAMWLRQMKRFFRSRPRVVGAFGQPMLFLISLGFGFGPVFRQAGQGNYLQFLGPGIIGMTIMFTAVFSGVELIWDRQFGFLKETLVAPVPRRRIMVGRTLGGASVALFQGLVVLVICSIFGFRPQGVMAVAFGLLFMFLIAMMFTAFGTALACMVPDFQAFQLIMNFLVMPMFFLSGALFPLKSVGRGMRLIASIDPFAYGVDGLRAVIGGSATQFGVRLDLTILVILALFLIGVSSRMFSRIQI
jgi:ABC-2 type transport system permease protein